MPPTTYRAGHKIDHYEIIQKLGQGLTSHVYLARDLHTQQQVVLKLVIDDLIGGTAIYARFLREKEIGQRLSHPNIQRQINTNEQRSQDYLIAEYVHGHTLREEIKQHAPDLLPADKVLAILLPVCEALVYAHAHGVIHRDIKPDNIILLENGEVKVIDFGIALLDNQRRRPLLGSAPLIGTPDYMPPERLSGEHGDERTDVYAVGVTLYELLCGRTPFQETDGFDFVSEHYAYDAPDILQFNSQVPLELATVVMRAIRRDQDQRYASIQSLLYDLSHLDEVTAVKYVPARPKFGGRFRQIMRLALIVLVVCLIIVALGLLAQWLHPATLQH